MEDLIERQAAIDAIAAYMPSLTTADGSALVDHDIFVAQETCVDCIQIIHELPPEQPEQKVGKWIIKDNPGTGWYRVTCSECGEDVTSEIRLIGFIPNCKALWDYCPYCGAKMEEQDE